MLKESKERAPFGRVVQFDRYGSADVLRVRLLPRPIPKPGEVLVRVHATGLNPKDAMIRSGALRLQTGRTFPRGTGFDLAGEVITAGPGVTDLSAGARVWGFLDGVMGGAAADYAAVPRAWLARMPRRLGWVEGAALPLAGSAALQALRDVARLKPGHRVLIRGASGGVGSAAIQIARAMGAHVTAITSAAGRTHCHALGADEVVERDASRPTLPGGRFDVYLDCVGRSSLRDYGGLLKPRGRWLAVAPSVPVFVLTPVSRLVAPILPVTRFGYVVVRPVAADLETLGRLVEDGRLRMPVAEAYPLEEVRTAQEDVGRGGGCGKTVLAVSAEAEAEAVGPVAEEAYHAGAA